MDQALIEARRRQILDQARSHGQVQVAELGATLAVASETIRRDLKTLEGRGLVRRIHGGAVLAEATRNEADTDAHPTSGEQRIVAAAMPMIELCESLFIDAGNATFGVVQGLLATDTPLTVVTHSLLVASSLAARPSTTVVMLAGQVHRSSRTTAGRWAADMLAELTVDVALLSVTGISRESGLSAADPESAAVKRVAIAASRRRVLLADHTKFGHRSPYTFGHLHDLDIVITDSGLPSSVTSRYRAAGTRLFRV